MCTASQKLCLSVSVSVGKCQSLVTSGGLSCIYELGHFWWIVNPAPVEPGVCGLAVSKQHGVSKLCLSVSVCRKM